MSGADCSIQVFLQQLFPLKYIIPVGVAFLLGSIIGIERQLQRKPAGLRTNIMICMGASIFTLIASNISNNTDAESRIIQGVVTGVGFLGAGVMMHQPTGVQGLTTAATIWLVTAIGIACGARLYGIAVPATIGALFVLHGLMPLERYLRDKNEKGHKRPINTESQ